MSRNGVFIFNCILVRNTRVLKRHKTADLGLNIYVCELMHMHQQTFSVEKDFFFTCKSLLTWHVNVVKYPVFV